MSQININISNPNDGLGDTLRNAFDETNQNFTELYSTKVDKVSGKGLSKNDYTDADKTKLTGIETGAQVNVQADLTQEDDTQDNYVIGRDALFGDQVLKVESMDYIANYGATLIIDTLTLPDDRSSISLTASATDLKSLQISGEFIRLGKPHYFKNRTGHDVKIWHLAGSGNVRYFFPNGLDLIVKNNEVVEFNLNANDSSNNKMEYVGISAISHNDLSGLNVGDYQHLTVAEKEALAPKASPAFTGTPTAPTATVGTNTTQLATTAFVLANSSGVSTSAANTWSAVQTYLSGMFGLRNIADTFTSYFSNANTASRTYTLPNRDMTVAGVDDIGIVPLNEGNGIGYVIGGRVAANYGNVGLNAIDLGYSTGASSTVGATASYSGVLSGRDNTVSQYDSGILSGYGGNVSGVKSGILSGNSNTISGSQSGILSGTTGSVTSDYSSILSGINCITSGIYGVSAGFNSLAKSFGEVAFGSANTSYTPVSATTWQGLDRIFGIGNGTSGAIRSDAFIILKNGLATLPSVTNALIIAEATGKAVTTREYVDSKRVQRLAQYTVSTLPTGAQGDMAYCTDLLAPTYMATATGGGSVVWKVFYDGTSWKVG